MKYRYYQNEAIQAPYDYFSAGNTGNPLIGMPTGTGKSVVIGGFCKRALQEYPNQRIIKLTHVKELIEQNFEKLMRLWPSAPAGIYSAGIGRKDTRAKITFAGIQSIVKNPEPFLGTDLALVDEAHLVSPNQETSYRKFFNLLKETNPYFKVIGLTATPYRLGLGHLTEGGIFTDMCYDITGMDAFNRLIDEGFILPLIPKPTSVEIDTSDIRMQGGEFIEKDLQAASNKEEITRQAIQEIMYYGQDRHHWLIFTTGVEHTLAVRNMLEYFGISAVAVHSNTKDHKMTKTQRREAIAGFKAGRYRAMVNNNILTTGFDFDGIDLIGMLRATQSPGLWVQMLGRGTRPLFTPGFNLDTIEGRLTSISLSQKQNCLVLDFAGNIRRLGPINDPVLPKPKGKKGGLAPVRLCENCKTYSHASVRICPWCGYEFPINVKFGVFAGTDDIIAKKDDPIEEIFKVSNTEYIQHERKDRPPAIKVHYLCGLRRFTEYVCLEHGGYAAKKARDFWRAHWKGDPESVIIPETTAQALQMLNYLKVPKQIRVWINKPYPEILGYDFTGDGFGSKTSA